MADCRRMACSLPSAVSCPEHCAVPQRRMRKDVSTAAASRKTVHLSRSTSSACQSHRPHKGHDAVVSGPHSTGTLALPAQRSARYMQTLSPLKLCTGLPQGAVGYAGFEPAASPISGCALPAELIAHILCTPVMMVRTASSSSGSSGICSCDMHVSRNCPVSGSRFCQAISKGSSDKH